MLFAVGHLCTKRGLDSWDEQAALSQLGEAMQAVKDAVNREKADPAFAYKRFFKSGRAKRYIEEAIGKLPSEPACTGQSS